MKAVSNQIARSADKTCQSKTHLPIHSLLCTSAPSLLQIPPIAPPTPTTNLKFFVPLPLPFFKYLPHHQTATRASKVVNFLPNFHPTFSQLTPQLKPLNLLPNLNHSCLLTNMPIIWAELGWFETMSSFSAQPISSYNHPPKSPLFILSLFSPALPPPLLKWLQLTCGWGESGVAWRESPVRLGPLPHKIT